MLIVEKDIENYLKAKVEGCGGKCLKFPATFEEGIPDRLVILPGGKIIFVELKRPKGGRLAPMQVYQIKKLKDLGCLVYVVHNYREVENMLKEVIEND